MKKLTALLMFAVAFVIAGQLLLEVAPAQAQILDPMIIRGRVTLDGVPTSANVIVSAFGPSGTALASTFTGIFGAPDEYELLLGLHTGVEAGELITVDAEPGLGLPFNFSRSVKTTLTSGATVTANVATFTKVPPVVRVPEGGTSFASVRQFVSISPNATATHSNGSPASVIGGGIDIPAIGGDLILPVAVPEGLTLESLTDTATGLTVEPTAAGALLRIPFTDDTLNDTIRVLVETTPFLGNGTSVTAQVTGLSIDLPTRSRDFSETSPDVGVGSVKVTGDISAFPGGALLEMRIEALPNEEVRSVIDNELARDEASVAGIAFSVEFITTKLDTALQSATLRLDVGKAWLDGHANDSVEVFRSAEDGSLERYAWIPVDPEADPVRFELVSNNGLSTFVIVAVKKAIENTPTPAPSPAATSSPPPPPPAPTSTPSPLASATPGPLPTATRGPAGSTETSVSPSSASSVATAVPAPTAAPAATATVAPASASAVIAGDDDADGGGGSCNSTGSGGQASLGVIGLIVFPIGFLITRRVSGAWERRF